MSEIILLTGGARSGKSGLAEQLAAQLTQAAELAQAAQLTQAAERPDAAAGSKPGGSGSFGGLGSSGGSGSSGGLGSSGGSAELAVESKCAGVLYIATAAVFDEEMVQRVKKHRAQRPAEWKTYEGFWNFNRLAEEADFLGCQTVLIDCLGFMLNNIMYHLVSDWEACTVAEMTAVEERMIQELETLIALTKAHGKSLVAVTNEVGMGLVPAERSSRYYRDILGRANRTVAKAADRVYFMVSGLPLLIKGNDEPGRRL